MSPRTPDWTGAPIPPHDHTRTAEGGSLDDYLRLDREGTQTMASGMVIEGDLIVDGTLIVGDVLTLANLETTPIQSTIGVLVCTFGAEGASSDRNWQLPDRDGAGGGIIPLEARHRSVVSKTSAYTLTEANDICLVDATGGAVTITLPTAAGKPGRTYTVKKIDASANAVTVDGDGSETIDGAANVSLAAQWDSVRLFSDGTNWLREG